jgi:hypothetical protein
LLLWSLSHISHITFNSSKIYIFLVLPTYEDL